MMPGAASGHSRGRRGDWRRRSYFSRDEGQREYWQIMDGKAGTPVDVVVRRKHQTLTFHLI